MPLIGKRRCAVKNRTDQLLVALGLLSLTLMLATCKGDAGPTGPMGTAGSTGPTGPTGPTGAIAGFKTAVNVGGVSIPGTAGVTNVLSLTLTAPSSGFVFVSATGYCVTNLATTTNMEWAYVIGTSASEAWSFPQADTRFPTGASAVVAMPITGERVFAVSAGANTFYLNIHTFSTNALSSCQGRLTGFFTASQLP